MTCGGGNGNPLQHSCLESSRDGGAWWLSPMGSHSRTRLKRLSSSGSSRDDIGNLITDKSKQHFTEWI